MAKSTNFVQNCKVQSTFSYESYHFKALKAIKLFFQLAKMYYRNVLLDLQIPLQDKSVKVAHLNYYYLYILLSVDASANRRNEIIFWGYYSHQIL